MKFFGQSIILALILITPIFGQSDRGSIRGTVTDQAGALIPGAKVTLTGLETGETRETVTNDDGIYLFPELRPTTYKISVEAEGFETTVIADFKVAVQVTHTLNINLNVGEISTIVTVDPEAESLTADSPVRQTNVTERQVKELPLIVSSESGGRTPLSFIFLDSNVGATDQSGGNNSSNFRVSGGQGAGVEILIDGASTRRTQNGNFFTEVAPGPNAYQEFTISTNSYSAEFGNSSGGIVNFTLKSGTNEFHGEVYDILQNEVLNANNVYNNARGLERDRNNQNNYGFNIGGPIYIPNFGEGTRGVFRSLKDRAFFFVNYEGYRFIRGANRVTTVPTVRMRNGDFSEYLTDPFVLNAFPNGIRIYDPRPGMGRTWFPNNIIPASAFDPAGFAILQYFPLPNLPGVHNNYQSSVVLPNTSNQVTVKTDFVLTAKQRLTLSYSWKDNSRIAGSIPNLPLPYVDAFSAWDQTFTSQFGRIQHDYTITSNLLNHLNIGYTYYDVGNLNTTYGFDTSSLGIPRSATPNLAFPLIDFVGDSNNTSSPRYSVDIGGVDFTDRIRDGALEIGDFLTYIRGKHIFKFGGSVRFSQFNVQQNLHPGGRFGFHEGQTGSDADPNPSGSAIASLITGATEWSFTENSSFDPAFRQISQSYFIQDDIKVNQKLTLNIGLRYDLPGQRTESKDRYRTFDPEAINPVTGTLGAIVGAGGQGGQAEYRSLSPTDYSNIGPRFGAAYAIDAKTVIRGGIGLYYAPILYGLNGSGTLKGGTIGYNVDTLFTPNGRDTPADLFLSNFRALTPVDPNNQYVADINADRGVVLPYFDKNFKTGRTLQYTVDLQRELPFNFVASIGYIGHRADRLRSNFGRTNAIPLDALRLGDSILRTNINAVTPLQREYAASVGVAIPASGDAVYAGFNGNVADALRPFPQYGTNFDNFLESKGESSYNALQLKLQRRFAQGLQFGMSYTFSKLVTNASEDILGGSALTGVLQNPFDTSSLKTISPTNSPHVFVANFIFELPFGNGRKYLDQGGFVNALVGGWQVGGIFRYQQGTPLVFSIDPNYGGNFLSLAGYNGSLRPNLTGQDIGSVSACNANVPAEIGREYVLNCQAFAAPPSFNGAPPFLLEDGMINPAYAAYYSDPLRFFGTAPPVIDDVRSPNFFSENLSLLKKTRITETVSFEIGAEFFNIFNRVRFLSPDAFLGFPNADGTFSNSNFGAIGATTEPRVIQLRARIIF